LVSPLSAQDFKGQEKEILIRPPEKSLKTRETLEYSVEWLGVPVGTIILRNEGIAKLDNHPCYHLSAQSYPNSFIRQLYDLEYKVHSYLDTRTLETRRFIKIRRMNKKFNYVVINFFPEKDKVVYKSWGTTDFVNFSKRREEIAVAPTSVIPDGTQDLLSSFYYFRLLKVGRDEAYPVNIYYNQANWPIQMKVENAFLREVRKLGSIEAVNVLIVSGLNDYILGKRKFSVCLSADSRRIPLEFKVGTAMGYIHGLLKELPK
jgi:hypothetical protein